MVKKRLNKYHRQIIIDWMTKEKLGTEEFEKQQEPRIIQLTQLINKILRDKYPESDMIVLRKYDKMTRKDVCLRFQLPQDGQVFGVDFGWRSEFSVEAREFFKNNLVDIPNAGGCHNNTVFVGTEKIRDIYETLQKGYEIYYKQRKATFRKYESFVEACRNLEEVEEIVTLPGYVRSRIISGTTALTTVSSDLIQDIKSDFNN